MRKKPGTNLRIGSWYRITEIDPSDPDPTLKVGDVIRCAPEQPGCIDPENHESDGMGTQWFADYDPAWDGDGAYRTLVNGVDFVRGPDACENGKVYLEPATKGTETP